MCWSIVSSLCSVVVDIVCVGQSLVLCVVLLLTLLVILFIKFVLYFSLRLLIITLVKCFTMICIAPWNVVFTFKYVIQYMSDYKTPDTLAKALDIVSIFSIYEIHTQFFAFMFRVKDQWFIITITLWGGRARDRMVVGFTPTCPTSAYHH